jgi:hypothetical protein
MNYLPSISAKKSSSKQSSGKYQTVQINDDDLFETNYISEEENSVVYDVYGSCITPNPKPFFDDPEEIEEFTLNEDEK